MADASEEVRRAKEELRREIQYNPQFSGGQLIRGLSRMDLVKALREPTLVLHERLKDISNMDPEGRKRAHVFMQEIFRDLISVLDITAGKINDYEGNSLLNRVREVLEMLIDAGAELDEENHEGQTALEMSILWPRPRLFQFLGSLGCDLYRYTLPRPAEDSLLWRFMDSVPRFKELAVETTGAIGSVFYEAVQNYCKRQVPSMMNLSPIMTIPFCPEPKYHNTHKSLQINMSPDAIHKEGCSILNAILVLPMKYIEEEGRFIVIQDPAPIYKTPCIKPTGVKNYRLHDMSNKDNYLNVAPGRFFHCPKLGLENKLTIRIAKNHQFRRCFFAVKLFQFHVVENVSSYCDQPHARHPGFGKCGGGPVAYKRVFH
ncbi:unnamed protein product [Caenorhabditis brenneri]